MSYMSKRAIVSMGAGILLLIVYAVYALGETSPAPDDLKAWALMMLIYVGAVIVAGIIIQIVFHIAMAIGISVKEEECDEKKVERIIKSSMLEDERYKLIELKSSNVSHKISGLGLVAALIVLAVGVSTIVALHVLAGSIVLGGFVEGCMIIFLNERGVQNG